MGAQKKGYEALYPRYAPVGYNIPLLRPKYKGFLKKSRSDCIKKSNSEKRTNQVGRFLAKLTNTCPYMANKNCLADAGDEKAACPSKRRGAGWCPAWERMVKKALAVIAAKELWCGWQGPCGGRTRLYIPSALC